MASHGKLHVQSSGRKRKRNGVSGGPPEKCPSPAVNSQAPRGINVGEFAVARALELHNMVEAISMADRGGRKGVFQSLPKHMRRRAVSHNVKRMPVRLRDFAKREEKNKPQVELKPKKKSRRQRRKTRTLLDDYNRRKKQNAWLETHIWHAKRMKMVNAWGFRLAEHSSDKSFRASHRAVANTCLLQDISYYGCIEIKGYKQHILSAMSPIMRQELGPSIASVEYMNSGKEGHVMLYHPRQYPYGAIGPVSYVWRQFPPTKAEGDVNPGDNAKLSQLWIWAHPSCYSEALEAIQNVCASVSSNGNKSGISTSTRLSTSCREENLPQDSRRDLITVSSLKFDLARLRLTGPLAHPLLMELLELPCEVNESATVTSCEQEAMKGLPLQQSDMVFESNNNLNNSSHVTNKQVNDSNGGILSPEDAWRSLRSAACSSVLPPCSTLGLTVLDPRLGLPGIRTSIDALVTGQKTVASHTNTVQAKVFCTKWPSHLAASSLWDSDARHRVKETKLDDRQLNHLRSNLLVPGTRLDLGDKTSHIPILLIQQPGTQGYSAGWDIILPSGWTMSFWIALVYRGARVGGLRESRNCSLECEVPYFPRDVPDTNAGNHYNEETQREGESKHARYPPNKRPNYHKLGVPSPFANPWDLLVNEWKLESEKLAPTLESHENENCDTELPNEELPTKTRASAISVRDSVQIDSHSSGDNEIDRTSSPEKEFESQATEFTELVLNTSDSCLENRVSENERFYVLRNISQLSYLRDTFTGRQAKRKGSEPNFTEDKLGVNPAHQIMKNNLRALVAVSLRMANQGSPLPNATVSIPSRSDLEGLQRCYKFGGPVEPLHKGPKRDVSKITFDSDTMIGRCTRKVIGFVTSGQYSLSRGCGVGIAYCALPGLVQLLSLGREGVVLIRNTSTQQYRFAFLSVL